MVLLELYGLMALVGVKLNAISVVNYCITIGLAVEFTGTNGIERERQTDNSLNFNVSLCLYVSSAYYSCVYDCSWNTQRTSN